MPCAAASHEWSQANFSWPFSEASRLTDHGSQLAATTLTSPVIFIHGAWHWGGCFQKVADLLAASGVPIATPDLASHGYNETRVDEIQTMDDYVAPVERLLAAVRTPVTLVGHSLGGAILSYLAMKYPDKIRKLIYLAAFLPGVGETVTDIIGTYAKDRAAAEVFQVIGFVGSGIKLDLGKPGLVKAAFYADCSDRDVLIAQKNVIPINTGVPYGWKAAPVHERSSIARVFIRCTADKALPINVQDAMIQKARDLKVLSLDSSHSPFFSKPHQLAKLILPEL
jgi:pimeloyl-ACP methyl ester carboxylesterase